MLKERFDNWFSSYHNTERNKTDKGYLHPPSNDNMKKWALESCSKISRI